MTSYFAIRANDTYTEFADSHAVVDFLNTLPELAFTNDSRWDSTSSSWFTLSLVVADAAGNFSGDGTVPARFNCVAIAASTRDAPSLLPTFQRIADHVGWELIDDGAS